MQKKLRPIDFLIYIFIDNLNELIDIRMTKVVKLITNIINIGRLYNIIRKNILM